MNNPLSTAASNPQAQFCLRFERHLRELATRRRCSIAVGFGPAWERALEDVPLEDKEQATVYWELIRRAQGADLFTGPRPTRA